MEGPRHGDGAPPRAERKAELRAWVRGRRRQLPHPQAAGAGVGFAEAVMGHTTVSEALDSRPEAPVLVYVEAGGEPPTGALRTELRGAGHDVFVPWALPDRQLRWLRDTGHGGDGLREARPWGLPGVAAPPEPDAAIDSEELLAAHPSVIVLPALAATPRGERLGQGGGYYDTLLDACPSWVDGGPLRVALVWPWEVVDHLPVEAHDHRVDLVVSYPPA